MSKYEQLLNQIAEDMAISIMGKRVQDPKEWACNYIDTARIAVKHMADAYSIAFRRHAQFEESVPGYAIDSALATELEYHGLIPPIGKEAGE